MEIEQTGLLYQCQLAKYWHRALTAIVSTGLKKSRKQPECLTAGEM